jgi:hypothetical protein
MDPSRSLCRGFAWRGDRHLPVVIRPGWCYYRYVPCLPAGLVHFSCLFQAVHTVSNPGAAMKVPQISIFLENRIGRLGEITHILAEAGVNIKALALADTSEFGILRLIVDKCADAESILKQNGVTVGRTEVVAVEVSHSPGGLDRILHLLQAKDINVEYMYGFPYRTEGAIMVFRFDRPELAVEILRHNGVKVFSEEEVC